MEKKFFGVPCQLDNIPEGINIQELVALAFAAPKFRVETAQKVFTTDSSEVNYQKLREALLQDLNNFFEYSEIDEVYYNKLINEKTAKWIKTFGFWEESEFNILLRFNLDIKIYLTEFRKNLCATFASPKEMQIHVSKYVKGQDNVIRKLSIYFYDHFLRFKLNINFPKISFLLLGNTGIGKSYTIAKFAEIMNVPYISINLVDIVPEGVVGKTISKELCYAYLKYDKDIDKLKNSIIEFSELDKIANNNSDYDRSSIQGELLRFFEKGKSISFQNNPYDANSTLIELPLENLMIAFNGAFSGIEDIIRKRLKNEISIELVDYNNLISYLSKYDLIAYGLLPELLSRISNYIPLSPLAIDDLYNIIKNSPESDLNAHIQKCELLDINLKFSDDAISEIAKIVFNEGLGARNINSVIYNVLENVYSEFDKYKYSELIVDSAFIKQKYYFSKYQSLFNSFIKNENLEVLAKKYQVSIDSILDIYNIYKSIH